MTTLQRLPVVACYVSVQMLVAAALAFLLSAQRHESLATSCSSTGTDRRTGLTQQHPNGQGDPGGT